MAEPKIGDLGLDVESEQNEDKDLQSNINKEKANLNVRDSEIQQFIRTSSIQLTEDQMRQAESTYVQIDERVPKEGEQVNGQADDQPEEEKKEEGTDAQQEDQPT